MGAIILVALLIVISISLPYTSSVKMNDVPVIESSNEYIKTNTLPPEWTEDIRLSYTTNPDTTIYPRNFSVYPQIALSNNYVHVVWGSLEVTKVFGIPFQSTANVTYIRSADNGRTWSVPITLSNMSPGLWNDQHSASNPRIAVNGSTVHVVWDEIMGADDTYRIRYRRSLDNGDTWEPTVNITPYTDTIWRYNPYIAVWNNNIHIVWDERVGTQNEIFYRNSTNSGANWNSPVRLTFNATSDDVEPKIAVNDTNIHLAWNRLFPGDIPELLYMKSLDNGISWQPEILLSPDDGWVSGATCIAVKNSSIHIGFVEDKHITVGGTRQAYYINSSDNGITFNPQYGRRLADTDIYNTSGTESISVNSGIIHVTYCDYRDGYPNSAELYYKNSTDGGLTWSYDLRLTYALNDTGNSEIAISNGFIHIVFQDSRTGENHSSEIFYKRYPDFPDIASPMIDYIPAISGITGEPFNITAKVTDDVAVDKVFLNYTDVLGANYNVSMSRWGDNWSYIVPGQNPSGTIQYFIWCNDTSNNANMTEEYQIQICDDDNPIAVAGTEQSVKEDDMVQFDGSDSTDNVGIVWYNWSFDDGSYQNGVNATPNHAYTNAGTYIVTLNVSDTAGNWDTDTCFVFVNNIAPIANAGIDKTGNEGVAITFNGSASADTPSDNSTLTYVWYFGDGDSGAGKVVSHAYDDNGIYNATLVVTDDNGYVDSDTCNVTVNNVAPAIIPVANKTAQQGVPFTLRINTTDVPADILTFSDNTTLFDINPVTGIIQFTPTNDNVGNHSVNVTVTDDDLGSSSITFKITVLDTNDPPTIQPIGSQIATQDVLFTLQVMASDQDAGDTLTYSLTAYPTEMTIASTGLITWTPTNAAVGSHAVTVWVSDSLGLSDEKIFAITVANVNDVPTISTSNLANATEDAMYLYPIQASDIDVNDTLTYSLDSALTFLSINPNNGLLYGTPTNAHVGTHQVIVNVTDGTTYITRTFNLTVINVNDTPTLNYIPPQAATEDVTFGLQLIGQDVDVGDTLTYSLISSPTGMTVNQATGLIAWTPTNGNIGSHTVIVRVSDASGEFAERSFLITVANVNDQPTIITTSIQNATEDSMYLATIHAEDVDGDVLTFSFDSAPSFLSISAETGLIYGMPTNSDVGLHQIVVNVSDGTTYTTRTFNLTVLNVNDLPVITSHPITAAKPGSEYTYTIIAEDAGDVLTYSLVEAPEGMTINGQTGKIAWTPTDAQAGQTYLVVFQVSDGQDSATQTYSIAVDELPAEPYQPLFDDYVWIGIIILLVTIIMLMLFYRFNREKKEKEPDNIKKED